MPVSEQHDKAVLLIGQAIDHPQAKNYNGHI